MDLQLNFRAVTIDWDDEVYFEITASNGECGGSVLLYGELDEFLMLGKELLDFPNNINHTVSYESGSAETYTYLLIKAYCYDPAGHTALQFKIRNGSTEPWLTNSQFSIILEAASLNRIGAKLATWDVKKCDTLICIDS